MSPAHLSTAIVALAVTGPLSLLAVGLVPAGALGLRPSAYARLAVGAALLALAAALLAGGALLALGGPVDFSWPPDRLVPLGFYLDPLSLVILALVSFLLAVVSAYAANYLSGESGHVRFTRWLCLTGAAVLTLAISGHLVQFALAWCATSLGLHQLLLFYRDRPGALLAARKKFLISRLGDLCLAGAIALVGLHFRTWNFREILLAAPSASGSGLVEAACLLLALGAMLKSAQFPFHSWLPDTMETPTPVSALMHAGIVNAGGFLVLRLAPLLAQAPAALALLALTGAFTAAFASLVMLTHASVKRALAFSTVAQMGFMMLEAGLGAFDLALLHLVAHSLYKAHAFLGSGGAVLAVRSAPRPDPSTARTVWLRLAFALLVPLAAFGLCTRLLAADPAPTARALVLAAVFVLALAHLLVRFWRDRFDAWRLAWGALLALALAASYAGWHRAFASLGAPLGWDRVHVAPSPWVLGGVLALGLAALAVHAALEARLPARWLGVLYVHARNGFYFGTLANRAVAAVWPVPSPSRPSSL